MHVEGNFTQAEGISLFEYATKTFKSSSYLPTKTPLHRIRKMNSSLAVKVENVNRMSPMSCTTLDWFFGQLKTDKEKAM